MKGIKGAGAIVYRELESGIEVLLVHRPKYQDWSFPKGKVDKGEAIEVAACREVHEETGIPVILDSPLGRIEYLTEGVKDLVRSTRKSIRYFIARESGWDNPVLKYRHPVKMASSKEIDDVRWVSIADALSMLTYRDDRKLLEQFERGLSMHESKVVLEIQVPQRVDKKKWHGKGNERPLTHKGIIASYKIADTLSSFGIDQLVLFSKKRYFTEAFEPYCKATGIAIKYFDGKDDPKFQKLLNKPGIRLATLKK